MFIFVSNVFISKKLKSSAPLMVGIDNINENLAASSLEKPRNNAPVTVSYTHLRAHET